MKTKKQLDKKERPLKRQLGTIYLGGGFSCLRCTSPLYSKQNNLTTWGQYPGYLTEFDKDGHWKPATLTLPCTVCGHIAPAKMTVEMFNLLIKARDLEIDIHNGKTELLKTGNCLYAHHKP